MIAVLAITGAAALTVIAYGHLRSRSPEASAAGLRAVRELAAVVLTKSHPKSASRITSGCNRSPPAHVVGLSSFRARDELASAPSRRQSAALQH